VRESGGERRRSRYRNECALQISRLAPGHYALWAEMSLGENDYAWFVPVSRKAGRGPWWTLITQESAVNHSPAVRRNPERQASGYCCKAISGKCPGSHSRRRSMSSGTDHFKSTGPVHRLAVSPSRTVFLRRPGCVLNTLLLMLALWLALLIGDSPEQAYFARAWFIARDVIGSILQSIWHFLGG